LVTVKYLAYDGKDEALNANLQKIGFYNVGHKNYSHTDGRYYHAYIDDGKPYLEFYVTTELHTEKTVAGAYFDGVFRRADHGVFTFHEGSKISFNTVQFVKYNHIDKNISQLIQSQDNYLKDTVQFQNRVDSNISQLVNADYTSSTGNTIAKEVLQHYANWTTISKYYVDNQSFQVLTFDFNLKNQEDV
jgi:hypothetical protein